MRSTRSGLAASILLFTTVTALFAFPRLSATNVVTRTYRAASLTLSAGEDPYAPRARAADGDQFKYSPAFALLYHPFTRLGDRGEAVAWMILNVLVFWTGVCLWFSFGGGTPRLEWLALIGMAAELNVSVLYQQVNALIAGMTLIALAFLRDGRMTGGAGALALAANLKVLPAVFLPFLFRVTTPRFWGALGVAGLCLVLLPVPVLGLAETIAVHRAWAGLLFSDAAAEGLLDIRSVMTRWGVSWLGTVLWWTVACGTLWGLVIGGPGRRGGWGGWIPLGLCAVLLLSPRSESPTFVLAAPAYAFLAVARPRGGLRRLQRALLLFALFLMTIAYTDVFPWHPPLEAKALGCLVLWGLSLHRALAPDKYDENLTIAPSGLHYPSVN